MDNEVDMTIFFRQLAKLPIDSDVLQQDGWPKLLTPAFYQTSKLSPNQTKQITKWLTNYIERSQIENTDASSRQAQMNKVNPKYVLRNYLAQQAIDFAHKGDFSMIQALQKVLRAPYDEQPEFEHFAQKRPDWAKTKPGCSMLSCSS